MTIIKVVLLIILIYILYYFYTKFRLKKKIKNTVCLDNDNIINNLQMGDIILTCKTNVDITKESFSTSLIGIDFGHVLMVVEKDNKKHFLHFVREIYKPKGEFLFNNKNMQLIDCKTFFEKYQINQPIYKLHKYKGKKFTYDDLIKVLIKYKDKKYCEINSLLNDNKKSSSCSIFIAKILSDLGIINRKDVSKFYFPNLLDKRLRNSNYFKLLGNFKL